MNILKINGTTRTIGESQGYLGLPLRDGIFTVDSIRAMAMDKIKNGPDMGMGSVEIAEATVDMICDWIEQNMVAALPPLRDIVTHDTVTGPGTPAMESLWEPSDEERLAIGMGANIKMTVVGSGHPPVMLSVADTNDAPAPEPRPQTELAGLAKEFNESLNSNKLAEDMQQEITKND